MPLLPLFLSLIACGDDPAGSDDNSRGSRAGDSGSDTGTTDSGAEDTYTGPSGSVRWLNLSPDSPALDVFVDDDGEAAIAGLGLGEGMPYVALPTGQHRFRFAPEGAGAGAALLDVPLGVSTDLHYTVAAIGQASSLTSLLLVQDLRDIPSDRIRLQYAHAAPGLARADLWNLSVDPSTPLFMNMTFGGHDIAMDLPAGSYRVGLDQDGDFLPDLTFTLPAFPGGSFVNLYAVQSALGAASLRSQLTDGTVTTTNPDPAQ